MNTVFASDALGSGNRLLRREPRSLVMVRVVSAALLDEAVTVIGEASDAAAEPGPAFWTPTTASGW